MGKSPWGKCEQKWSKMAQKQASGVFEENLTINLVRNLCKRKFLWFINILRKLHAWEKSGSQVRAKNGSWPIRFQYSLIINI